MLQVEDGPYPVLIVDDDAQVAQTLGAGLSNYNCITHCSYSYDEAIAFLDGHKDILVVLTDIEMPGTSGLSIANYIAKARDEATLSNVVVMTGGACDHYPIDALRAKVFDFTRKPVRIADLAVRVKSAAIDALRRRQRAADTQLLKEQLSIMQVERVRLEASLARLVDANHAIAANGNPESSSLTVPAVELQRVLVPGVVPDADHIQPEQAFRYAAVVASAADHLDDKTLLEFVLTLVAKPEEARRHAAYLLESFSSYAEVLSASISELTKRGQLSTAQAACLKAINASAVRLLQTRMKEGIVLTNWDQLSAYLYASLAGERVETFRILYLDKKNRIVSDEVQTRGTIDFVSVHIRECIRRTLELDASKIILVHNHPSGDPSPSQPDIRLTREIASACSLMEIELVDHIIVGRDGVLSLRALGHLRKISS